MELAKNHRWHLTSTSKRMVSSLDISPPPDWGRRSDEGGSRTRRLPPSFIPEIISRITGSSGSPNATCIADSIDFGLFSWSCHWRGDRSAAWVPLSTRSPDCHGETARAHPSQERRMPLSTYRERRCAPVKLDAPSIAEE
eukprot:scaffold273310_cov36-Tisochrysis_lutea.AAC.1